MFLRVRFGDNDFGNPVTYALRRIWQDVDENNGHLLGLDGHPKSLSQIFEGLYKSGTLQLMVELAIDCEYNYGNVEFATRGLYYKEVDWDRHREEIKKVKQLRSITTEYLNVHLSLRNTKAFSKAWQNGEEAILNLETGEVSTY